MPVPSKMSDLQTLAASNSPAGSDAIGNSLDDYMRAIQAIVRSTNAISSASIASASTTDLGSSDAEVVSVTGTATITSFGTTPPGITREVYFQGSLILTNSTAIQLAGGINYTTTAGDVLRFRSLGSGNWKQVTSAPIGFVPVNKAGDSGVGNISMGTLTATNVTSSGAVTTGQNVTSSTITLILAPTGTGQVFIRPNGAGSTTGQVSFSSSGDVSTSGTLTAGQNLGSSTTNVVLFSASGGTVFLRPNGAGSSTGQATINSAGTTAFSGIVSAPDFTYTSDVRLKMNVNYAEPRDLSDIPIATWNWITAEGGSGRGVIAQTVQRYAPDLVQLGETGILTVDKLNLVLERVAYLEQKLKKAGLW